MGRQAGCSPSPCWICSSGPTSTPLYPPSGLPLLHLSFPFPPCLQRRGYVFVKLTPALIFSAGHTLMEGYPVEEAVYWPVNYHTAAFSDLVWKDCLNFIKLYSPISQQLLPHVYTIKCSYYVTHPPHTLVWIRGDITFLSQLTLFQFTCISVSVHCVKVNASHTSH